MRWLYLAPTLIINVAIILVPALLTVALAFFRWDGIIGAVLRRARQFPQPADDRTFWTALGNNVIWTVIFLVVPIGMGLLAATMLLIVRRGSNFFQVVYFLPVVIATAITARIWQGMIYSPGHRRAGAARPARHDYPEPARPHLRPLFMASPRSIFGTGGAFSASSSSPR